MQIGNCWLTIDRYKSTLYRKGVTPAEVAVLREGFFHQANGPAITQVFLTGEKDIDDHIELSRLRTRYRDLRNGKDEKAVSLTFPVTIT